MEQFVRHMWDLFMVRKAWARSVLADAVKGRQDGIVSDGQ